MGKIRWYKLLVKTKRVNRSKGGDFLIISMLMLFGAFMALPVVYAVVQAFKPLDEIFIFPPRFFVVNPTTANFKLLLQLSSTLWVPFSRYIFNSVFVTCVVTFFHIIFASMAAYALQKHRFPGRVGMSKMVQLALLFTGGTLAIPTYIVMSTLGMVDTYWAVILPPIAGSMGLFLMTNFMVQVPDALIEAARIDGANEFYIYWNIIMPIVKGAWLTLLILAFQGIWSATGQGIIYSEQLKLLPLAMSQIALGGIARVGVGSAAAFIMMLPPIVTFVITQSNVIETMASAGIKE